MHFAKFQKAVVFLSIDTMWVLHEWFLAAIIVLFLIASSLLSLFLSAGSRVLRHTTYAFLASLVVFLHSGFHHGFLDSLIALAGGTICWMHPSWRSRIMCMPPVVSWLVQ